MKAKRSEGVAPDAPAPCSPAMATLAPALTDALAPMPACDELASEGPLTSPLPPTTFQLVDEFDTEEGADPLGGGVEEVKEEDMEEVKEEDMEEVEVKDGEEVEEVEEGLEYEADSEVVEEGEGFGDEEVKTEEEAEEEEEGEGEEAEKEVNEVGEEARLGKRKLGEDQADSAPVRKSSRLRTKVQVLFSLPILLSSSPLISSSPPPLLSPLRCRRPSLRGKCSRSPGRGRTRLRRRMRRRRRRRRRKRRRRRRRVRGGWGTPAGSRGRTQGGESTPTSCCPSGGPEGPSWTCWELVGVNFGGFRWFLVLVFGCLWWFAD